MTCANCAASIERALQRTPGVTEATVNFALKRAHVRFDPDRTGPATLEGAIAGAGYQARPVTTGARPMETEDAGPTLWAFLLSLPLVYLTYLAPHVPATAWTSFVLATLVQFGPGRTFYTGAFRSLRSGVANMDVLVALGVTAAYGYSCVALFLPHPVMPMFDTAALLITFISGGKLLEARVRGRASRTLTSLLGLEADRARRADGVMVPLSAIALDDLVLVRAGERIPIDGVVTEGRAAVDESMVSGESAPVARAPGDPVVGGTVATDGALTVRATVVGADTFLARIIRLVEQAQADRPPIQKFVDRIAAVFVPTIVGLALLTFAAWYFALAGRYPPPSTLTPTLFALDLAIAVLVVACPCAMGLATPLAVLAGSGVALRAGILFRRATAMEVAAQLDTLVLDKTGTLTRGQLTVAEVDLASSTSREEALALAAALASGSAHPLSRAVAAAAQDGTPPRVTDLREYPGQGVEARSGPATLRLGSPEWACPGATERATAQAKLGRTPVVLARDDQPIAVFGLTDEPRTEAALVVRDLQSMGLRLVLASGDRPEVVQAAATRAGLTEQHANQLPAGKAELVRQLRAQGRKVGMIGDGINDAPALAAADLGIAIGSGTAVAKETGDLILVHSDLRDVARAIRVGRATLTNIRQNLFWAFFYNALAVPVAAGALYPWRGITLPPELCGLMMALSSVTVVLNSLRLRWFRP